MELKNIPRLLDEVKTLGESFFKEHESPLNQLIASCSQALEQGQTIFFFGNGGSASQAQHLAAELVNRFLFNREPLAAIALTCDSSILTSIANDFDFRDIFRRQLQALGKPGDVAIGLSTSGTSENVALALQYAKKAGLITAGFLGNDGGRCKDHCDFPLTVRSSDTPRIQEIHLLLGHILCEQVERKVCIKSC
ncbi:MAG: SIS domain-containing protein [Pseudomonadota bacterium]|nr:SIS domain-containing protein [Pseudomonadota bacterium]